MNNNIDLKQFQDGLNSLYQAVEHLSNQAEISRNENTGSIEIIKPDNGSVDRLGIVWKNKDGDKSLFFRAAPDRLWSSESIDLKGESYYSIGNVAVLRLNELGSTVVNSNLRTLGTVKDFKTTGDFVLDHYIYWNSNTQRLGIGTESANAMLSVVSLDSEFIVDHRDRVTHVGTWTTNDLAIVTDDTPRITITASGNVDIGTKGSSNTKVSVYGRLGIGMNNVDPGVSIETAGPIRIEGKKIETGDKVPANGNYKKGDLVWNSNPSSSSYVGWICVRDGTPGIWKPFGKIAD
jgi:hypothetical protein